MINETYLSQGNKSCMKDNSQWCRDAYKKVVWNKTTLLRGWGFLEREYLECIAGKPSSHSSTTFTYHKMAMSHLSVQRSSFQIDLIITVLSFPISVIKSEFWSYLSVHVCIYNHFDTGRKPTTTGPWIHQVISLAFG